MTVMEEAIQIGKKRTFFKKLRGDKMIWLVVLIFAMISLLVVYSSTSSLAARVHSSSFSFLMKQMTFFIVGFVGMFICYRIPLGFYRKISLIAMIVSIVLLVLPFVFGDGLRRFSVGGVTIQSSEIAKIATILYLARVLETSKLDTFIEYALKILLPLGITCVLCVKGSFSATLIIAAVSFVILFCAGVKKKYLAYTFLIALVCLGIIWLIAKTIDSKKFGRIETVEARIERFFVKEDPSTMSEEDLLDYKKKQFQSQECIEAIKLGKITGLGPGNSVKRFTLPNAFDDCIFSIIVEEYGLLGGIFVILLYIWLFYRCILISRACKKTFSTIVVLGYAILIVLQAFIHIMVNVGLIPVTGQTLPLISQGGTSIVMLSCAIGIILSVNRTIEVKVEMERKDEKNEKDS